MAYVSFVKLTPCDFHFTPLMIVNFSSDNGLVLSGNKPLPEPVLCHHMVSLGHIEFKVLHGKQFQLIMA